MKIAFLASRTSLAFASILLSLPCTLPAISQDVNNPWPADPYYANNRQSDERFKADILVVVAHPDDEIMAAAFMAEQVDKGKRGALVWTTRGDGGTNTAGPGQAAALGDVRGEEPMAAAGSLRRPTVWC